MLELLTSAIFYMSLPAAPSRDIPRNVPGEQLVFKPGTGIEGVMYRGMPCPYKVPKMVTVFDQESGLCVYITKQQLEKLPQEDRG